MTRQTPILMYGRLTGSIFIVTRYKEDAAGPYEALEKFDVTEQFHALCEEIRQEEHERSREEEAAAEEAGYAAGNSD